MAGGWQRCFWSCQCGNTQAWQVSTTPARGHCAVRKCTITYRQCALSSLLPLCHFPALSALLVMFLAWLSQNLPAKPACSRAVLPSPCLAAHFIWPQATAGQGLHRAGTVMLPSAADLLLNPTGLVHAHLPGKSQQQDMSCSFLEVSWEWQLLEPEISVVSGVI